MKKHLPHRALRDRPDLDQLKRQAKELLRAFVDGQDEAIAEVNAHYRDADRTTFALHDAQLVLGRSYGFDSWPKLKAYVDGVTTVRMCDAVERGDISVVGEMRLGASYQAHDNWRFFGGWRVVGITGVARATEQIPSQFLTPGQVGVINSDGSMLVHGLQMGIEFSY